MICLMLVAMPCLPPMVLSGWCGVVPGKDEPTLARRGIPAEISIGPSRFWNGQALERPGFGTARLRNGDPRNSQPRDGARNEPEEATNPITKPVTVRHLFRIRSPMVPT